MAIAGVSQVGLCVSNLERSLAFYCSGLGFEQVESNDFGGKSWSRVTQVHDLHLRTVIVRRDGISLELLDFVRPGHIGDTALRPMNQLGLTHIAVWVDDIDAEAERLAAFGLLPMEETRTTFDHPHFKARWLMCTDPDGVRVELVEYPAGAARIFGS